MKKPYALLLFLFLAVAAGGFALLGNMENRPDWFVSLLPSSSLEQHQPSETRQAQPPALERDNPVTPTEPVPATLPPIQTAPQPAEPVRTANDKEAEAPPTPAESAPEQAEASQPELPQGDTSADETPEKPADSDEATPPALDAPAPVILYGKGTPVNPEGSIVRGEIPPGQKAAARSFKGREDSVVGAALVDDLARFLADNYWPAGTHPMARSGGISTAGLRWANMRYGAQLHGFAVDHGNIPAERARVLRYVFMPSMIRGLYGLYESRFVSTLENLALNRQDGPQAKAFTNAQVADMFAAYAAMARGIAGSVHAYRSTPDIKTLAVAYADAATEANSAYMRFAASMETGGREADAYQAAVMRRERARENLAAAMRRGGNTKGLDGDSLVYTAMWLYRRGDGKEAAVTALAEICNRAAERLGELETFYRQRPARRIASADTAQP